MIDEIFEMIMKEARGRPGKDLVLNINKVLLEVSGRLTATQENLRQFERRHKVDEN